MVEKCYPCFFGVERILGENISPGRGRGPGVNQRCLNDSKSLVRSRRIAAALIVDQGDRRILFKVTRKVAKLFCKSSQDIRIDFDSDDTLVAEYQGCENVPASANSDNQNRSGIPQMMRDGCDIVFEIFQRFYFSVEFRNDG